MHERTPERSKNESFCTCKILTIVNIQIRASSISVILTQQVVSLWVAGHYIVLLGVFHQDRRGIAKQPVVGSKAIFVASSYCQVRQRIELGIAIIRIKSSFSEEVIIWQIVW
jgi:hypothetical protein